MNNKKDVKNRGSLVKKIILSFVITLVLMFGYNLILEYNESKNSYKIKKDDKLLLVKYTLVDKNEVPEGSSIDDLWMEHFDALYNIVIDNIVLEKENDYYVADLNYVNESLVKDITDVDFAMNNDLGQVIDDCKFDKDNLKIYIPTKYFEKTQTPVQTQIMSRIDTDEVTINYKKGNKTRKIKADVYDNVLKIPVVNSEIKANKLNRDDISLYVNGKKYYLDDSNSKYLKNNGSLDISYNGALVRNIEVKVNRNNLFKKVVEKIFAASIVKASGVSGTDFSKYASLGNLRKSQIGGISEDNVWYIKGTETNYKVHVTQREGAALSQFLTNCNERSSNMTQFDNCAQTPFDSMLQASGASTQGESSISSLSYATNTYCPAFATAWFNAQGHSEEYRESITQTYRSYCTTYYNRVYNCISNGKSSHVCKQFAYFEGSDNFSNFSRLEKAFDGFLNSSPKLIFKREYGEYGGQQNVLISTTDQAKYTNFLYRYVMLNNSSYPTNEILPNISTGTVEKQANVIQWIRLPQKGATAVSAKSGRNSTTSTFPLDVYYAMEKYDGYVAAACGHINASAYDSGISNDVVLGVKIAKKTNDYVIIAFATQPAAAGEGEAQATYALYKFDIFDDTKTKLRLTKNYVSDESTDVVSGNEVFKVYEATKSGSTWNCGTQVGQLSYSSGTFQLNDTVLVDKSYCVVETVNDNDFKVDFSGSDVVATTAKLNGNTVKAAVITFSSDSDRPDSQGYYTKSINATNTRRKYCYGVKKVDLENNSLELKSTGDESNQKFTFTSNGQTITTTTQNSTAVFGPFKYGTYTVSETNISEGVTADQGIYWTNASPATISTSDLVEATYSDGIPECPTVPAAKLKLMQNVKHYYCARIKKVDASNGNIPLAGAKFTSTNLTGYNSQGTANGDTIGTDGYYYFFTGNSSANISVTESKVPDGYYANELSKTVSPVLMSNSVRANSSIADQIAACNSAYENKETTIFQNFRYLLNWYKVEENNQPINGAKFKVQDPDGKYLKLGTVQEQADKDGNVKKCYPLTGTTTNIDEATEVVSQNVGVNTDQNGETCIMGLTPGNYKVIETDSAENHTLGSVREKTISSNESYQNKTNNNTFVNYPTRVELDKKSTSTDEYTNSELSKIIFNLYRVDQNGNPIGEPITLDDLGNGLYDYISQTTQTSSLHVNGEAKLEITHLPKDDYIIMENQMDSCDDSTDPTKCIGYYMPTGSENGERFTITKCSSDEATSCGIGEYGKEIVTVWNTPTEIDFTELDYYRIYDPSDIAIEGNTVDGIYSTQMDRSDFDRMVFTLYDKNNNPVSLQFVGNHGDCTSDNDYAEYRYVIGGEATGVTELHTCGGHLRVTHLCRGATYTIKEQSVAENSVFVLEDTPSTPTQKDYKIACKPDDPKPPVTETNILENKPTRVTFEKRDAKYSYLIPDETTTFEVYRCPNGEECHPGDYSTVEQREAAGMELVKFYSRAVIPGDEEDSGVEVYKMMSYSDAQNRAKCEGNNTNNCYVTSIHPIGGKVIFRYLASGYNYVLYETVAPKNYLLPEGRRAETEFTVRTDTVSVEEVKIPNQPTGLLIRKYDDEGRLLGGAKFKVSEVVNYNPNKKAQEQQLTNLKFKTIKQGVYEYRPVLDSSLVITCEGSSCSDTSSFSFDQDWSNFDTLLTSSGETIKNVLTEGTAIIQYLEYGKYYVIEEVEAPKGHSLPEGDARYTLIHIGENTSVIEDTEDTFINYPTAFTFYKFDEYNSPLDGGKFKLQKLNENKSYITLNVTKVEGEDSLYKVDNTSTNDIIETTNGKATVYYLEEGQYRVVEVQAPDGKELPKKTLNVATFFVDKDGNVFGENIITNKAPTDKTIVKPTAKANLIINIQTGQNVVKYGLIIAILVAAITGLMIYMKKRK